MSLVADGQRAAEALMTLTLTAYEPGGTTVDADGFEVRGYTPQGQTFGKVQAGSRAGGDVAARLVKIGDVSFPVIEAGLHLPIGSAIPDAGTLGAGWEYVVTSVGPSDDPALLGRRYLVVGVPAKSFATARRLDVVDITGVL